MVWKVGDMCFFEFELSQVKEVKGGNVIEVSTGYIRTSTGSGFNDRSFPVTLEIKLISNEYDSWSREIHKKGLRELNFPDIHRWLVAHWATTCQKPSEGDRLKERYGELSDFAREILDKCEESRKFVTSYGIPLFR